MDPKRKRRFGEMVLTVVGAVLLLAVIELFSLSEAAGQTLPKVRIGLSTRFYGPVLPSYLAQELKLYEKFGVVAEINAYKGGGEAMEALAAGAADIINYFPPGVALASKRGVKAKVVASGTLRPTGWYMMVKKDSPITSPKDLAGKKVGVTAAGSTTDFFTRWVADKAKVKVDIIPVGGGGLIPNLLAGNLDAILAFPPIGYRLLLAGDGRILVDLGKEMEPNLPDVWVASQAIIEKNPTAVRGILKALYAAARHLKQNPQFAVQYIKDFNNYELPVARMEYERTIMGLSDEGLVKREWLQNSLDLARLAGLGDLPPVEEIFTDQFVPVRLN